MDDLAVASFSTGEDGLARGTVRGASGDTLEYASCVAPESCAAPCNGVETRADTCPRTCHITCDGTCGDTCIPRLC